MKPILVPHRSFTVPGLYGGAVVRLCGKIWQRVSFQEIGNHRAVGHLGEQGFLDKLPRGRRALPLFGVGTASPPRAYRVFHPDSAKCLAARSVRLTCQVQVSTSIALAPSPPGCPSGLSPWNFMCWRGTDTAVRLKNFGAFRLLHSHPVMRGALSWIGKRKLVKLFLLQKLQHIEGCPSYKRASNIFDWAATARPPAFTSRGSSHNSNTFRYGRPQALA